jgi:hypothetical protein
VGVPIAVSADGKTLEPGKPVSLIRGQIVVRAYTGADKPQYAVTPDGQRFLLVVPAEETPAPITVILNWAPTSSK